MNPIHVFERKLNEMRAKALVFSKMNLASTPDHYKVKDAEGKLVDLHTVFETALNASDEDKKAMARMLSGCRDKNRDDIEAMQALRTENIELYVRAMSNFGLFFHPVALADNEQSCYVHSYRNPVNVKHVAQDGHIGTTKAVRAQKQVFVDMREISAEIGYQIRDINLGNDIVAAANATVDVAWDLENKIDYEAYKMFINGGIFAPFVVGKPGASNALSATFIPNWRINQANLPTTNDIVLSSTAPVVEKLGLTPNGTSTNQSNLFRFDVIQAVIDYCESFGNIFGSPLRPTGAIIVPSSDVSGMTASVKPLTLFFNEVAEDVLKDYSAFEYLKTRWVMIPDVTLPPGCCYFVMNRPVGEKITKPSLDWEEVDTNRKKNWETRTAVKTLQYYVPEPSRVNALRVTYSSTYSDPTLN